MPVLAEPELTAGGRPISTDPDRFGWLRDSTDAVADPAELRRRMDDEGYLFLPGFLNRDDVRAVREGVMARFVAEGVVLDAELGRVAPGRESYFRPDLANDPEIGADLRALIYSPRVMALFDAYFGEPARHFDFTWMRAITKNGTFPHCDAVYMNRGARDVITMWTPLGDVPLEVGGLLLLEGSNHDRGLTEEYCELDVDAVCDRPGFANRVEALGYQASGAIAADFETVRTRDGGRRWLTAREYRMGDVLLFTVRTAHGSLDNRSDRLRISSDSRYQRASEPMDPRWAGESPPAHGPESKIAAIC